MSYEQRWYRIGLPVPGQSLPGSWRTHEPIRTLFDDQLRQVPQPEWDLRLRDEYLDQEWARLLKETPASYQLTIERALAERRTNGGVECDMETGPCACGAWHAPLEYHADHVAWIERNELDPKTAGTVNKDNPGPQAQPLLPIEEWWLSTARTDLDSVLPKMQEYGSFDLVAVGQLMAHAMQWDDVTPEQLTELGCWFYLQGKVARAFDALRQHRLPSDDTTYDIGVYSMMVRRIREVGGWK